ncbi:MAG: hypothetical protein V4724_32680 [Pseudomonadota bacterium]
MQAITILRLVTATLLAAVLGGCASGGPLREVRDFAAESARLDAYAELSTRFRDTYQREQPYLSAAADQQERLLDAGRRDAYPDLIAIGRSLALYMQTLGQLADARQVDLKPQITDLGSSIKAWPDTGLSDRHVNAYASLGNVLARAAAGQYQQRAAQAMLRDGAPQVQTLLEAMQTLLRYYDKSSDNEQRIVLGMLDLEIPYADTPGERLLAALAKSHRQAKIAEYRLTGLRHTLAAKQVAAIARGHQALLLRLDQPDNSPARDALALSGSEVRAANAALAAPILEGVSP